MYGIPTNTEASVVVFMDLLKWAFFYIQRV